MGEVGGRGGYKVACNLLNPGEGKGGSSAKDVSERLREWIEEEERRRRRSVEDGARSGNESSLSSLSPRCYVEDAYRVGTTARQCLEVLSSIGDDDDESSLPMDDHYDEVCVCFRSYLEGK